VKGAGFQTSRPGNILIDSQCVLHALVFEPTDITINDYVGKLTDYKLAGACAGDINTFTSVQVIAGGTSETVNMRVGAAVSDKWLGFAYGAQNKEKMYSYETATSTWVEHTVDANTDDHDLYYPFLVATDTGATLVPVQNDYVGPN